MGPLHLVLFDMDGTLLNETGQLYPGAAQAVRDIHARPTWLMGIATGMSRSGLEWVLQSRGLRSFFDTLQTADGHQSKPNPSMGLAALADVGAAPAQAVMIGDTAADMAMARTIGMAAIGVTWGHHSRDRLISAGADLVIDRFDALLPALDDLWRAEA